MRHPRIRLFRLALLLGFGAPLLAACEGAEVSVPRDAGFVDSGVDIVDAGRVDPPPSDSVVVEVWADDPVRGPVPQAGALVAFGAPGGERMEAVADEEGLARFEGFEWADGEATLTVYSDTAVRLVQSYVGLTVEDFEDGRFALKLEPEPASPTVEVRGRLTSMLDVDHMHTVSVDHFGFDSSQVAGPVFALEVPASLPFTLVALEWSYRAAELPGHVRVLDQFFHGWTRFEHPGLDADGAIDVDMSDRLPVRSVTHAVAYPPALQGDLIPYVTVAPRDSNLFVGAPTRLRSTTSSVSFEIEYADLGPGADYDVTYAFYEMDVYYGWLYVAGDPRTPPAPLLVAPILRSAPSRRGLLAWDFAPDEAPEALLSTVWVVNSQLRAVVHAIRTRSTTARIPDLPTGLDPTVVYGEEPLVVVAGCRLDADESANACSYGPLVALEE